MCVCIYFSVQHTQCREGLDSHFQGLSSPFPSQHTLVSQKISSYLSCEDFHSPSLNGDCSREIKRHLLLGRKVMTNLDSIFTSRDITLPTKVHLVKAMVFPVVMYRCESWTVKKAEH